MSKKKKIIIEEYYKDKSGKLITDNIFSKITMKFTEAGLNSERKFTLRNHAGPWTKPKEKRASITIYDSANQIGAPEITIKTALGNEYTMTLLELADIRDITNHFRDLGQNIFTDTRVISEEK